MLTGSSCAAREPTYIGASPKTSLRTQMPGNAAGPASIGAATKAALSVGLLAAWLLATGCGAGTTASRRESDRIAPRGETSPAGGTHQHAHGPVLPATGGPGYSAADVRFMQDMIGHHEQAITMARMAPARGAGEAVRRLARKIEVSQRDEIAMMEAWLEERGQVVPDEEYRRAKLMPGMLTAEQMAELDAARGAEFDRLFLEYMIQHHVGALEMVAELFATPGAGQDPDVFRFATDVDADQRAEIAVMQALLERLASGARRPDR